MQEPSCCPPSRHHSPRTSGGPGGPVSSEPTAGFFQGWTVDRSTQATRRMGATAPAPAWSRLLETSGRVHRVAMARMHAESGVPAAGGCAALARRTSLPPRPPG